MDEREVSFRWKDYRTKGDARYQTMTLAATEFMRRFLLHVLPGGFHRIRHYGLLSNGARSSALARARELLNAPTCPQPSSDDDLADPMPRFICRHCGRPMTGVEILLGHREPRAPPLALAA